MTKRNYGTLFCALVVLTIAAVVVVLAYMAVTVSDPTECQPTGTTGADGAVIYRENPCP